MKSFVAARCARRQLEVEVGASSRVLELEERASALQKEKKDLDASLASVRIRAETSIKQLEEARDRAKSAKDAAKNATSAAKTPKNWSRSPGRPLPMGPFLSKAKCKSYWSVLASKLHPWQVKMRILWNS